MPPHTGFVSPRPCRSIPGEDFVEARRVDHAVGPGFQLRSVGIGDAIENVLRQRAETAGELTAQDRAFTFDDGLWLPAGP